mmetsp:Transcript_6936/g.21674  ORF Transcript_6936/g.21674 Transcript_6936/m.21674 type:complete len:258 (-) Transcript_6936:627-1400(-)
MPRQRTAPRAQLLGRQRRPRSRSWQPASRRPPGSGHHATGPRLTPRARPRPRRGRPRTVRQRAVSRHRPPGARRAGAQSGQTGASSSTFSVSTAWGPPTRGPRTGNPSATGWSSLDLCSSRRAQPSLCCRRCPRSRGRLARFLRRLQWRRRHWLPRHRQLWPRQIQRRQRQRCLQLWWHKRRHRLQHPPWCRKAAAARITSTPGCDWQPPDGCLLPAQPNGSTSSQPRLRKPPSAAGQAPAMPTPRLRWRSGHLRGH